MLANILIGAAVVLVVLVVVILLQPSTFHVERSISILAAPDKPFAKVNDFHAWDAWSPWEGKDPALKKTYSGAASGVGAGYAWVGNKDVGEGRMTIETSDAPRRIGIKIEFIKPFSATNQATYSFVPADGGTRVTWAMDGNKNFVLKAFHLFVNIDKLIGPDFERGLLALKKVSEAS